MAPSEGDEDDVDDMSKSSKEAMKPKPVRGMRACVGVGVGVDVGVSVDVEAMELDPLDPKDKSEALGSFNLSGEEG